MELGLIGHDEHVHGTPLGGGVSSDIWKIDLPFGPVVAKQALARLRVAAEWTAPPERIIMEAGFNRFVDSLSPGWVTPTLAYAEKAGVLVTHYLDPDHNPVWKEELRQGRLNAVSAKTLGQRLAAIHSASAGKPELRSAFYNPDLIFQLRLGPYFSHTARVHADISEALNALIRLFEENTICLIHGDFSPKNILIGPSGPVILDAECANYGDPAFDAAFVLCHLMLKSVWKPQFAHAYHRAFLNFIEGYEDTTDLPDTSERIGRYLPGLLLARIDGKSPVEYITSEETKMLVRRFAKRILKDTRSNPNDIAAAWFTGKDGYIAMTPHKEAGN